MIPFKLGDGGGNGYEAQLNKSNGDIGLKVFSEPLRTWVNDNRFFSNEEFGIDLNQDGSAGGTPLGIHNGGDNTYWTGSNIVGANVTFNSTTRPRTGTASIYVNAPALSDTWQFAKGSSQSLTNYVSVTMWINVDRRWNASGENVAFFGFDTGTGLEVGTRVNLDDYFNQNSFDTWQLLTIPLDDMGLTGQTIDSFRMQFTLNNGTSPEFFIDDFELQETGAPIVFTIEPEQQQAYQVYGIDFTFIDALNTTLASNSMLNLAYDQILGLSKLDSGITLSRIVEDTVEFSATVTCLYEFLRISGQITNSICDGTNTSITIRITFSEPIELRGDALDKITIQVADDLSGLLGFNAFALGRSRTIHSD